MFRARSAPDRVRASSHTLGQDDDLDEVDEAKTDPAAVVLDADHLFLGMVYRAMDRPDLAEPEFERALEANPDSSEALRELRLLHLRHGQSPGRGPKKN